MILLYYYFFYIYIYVSFNIMLELWMITHKNTFIIINLILKIIKKKLTSACNYYYVNN